MEASELEEMKDFALCKIPVCYRKPWRVLNVEEVLKRALEGDNRVACKVCKVSFIICIMDRYAVIRKEKHRFCGKSKSNLVAWLIPSKRMYSTSKELHRNFVPTRTFQKSLVKKAIWIWMKEYTILKLRNVITSKKVSVGWSTTTEKFLNEMVLRRG